MLQNFIVKYGSNPNFVRPLSQESMRGRITTLYRHESSFSARIRPIVSEQPLGSLHISIRVF